MKNFLLIIGLISCVSIQTRLVASELDDSAIGSGISEFDRFFEKYALPQEVVPVFEAHADSVLFSNYYQEFKSVPAFYIKDEKISRLINAERMRRVILRNNLTCLDAPKKYIYKSGNKLKVLADTVEVVDFGELSKREVQQMVILIEKTGYHDWHRGNILRSAQTNKLTLIDTENNAFVSKKQDIKSLYGEDPESIFYFVKKDMVALMDINASRWFKNYLVERDAEDVLSEFTPLPTNQEYDDEIGIDFEEVKAQYRIKVQTKSKL